MTRRKAVKVWTWRRMLRDSGPKKKHGFMLTMYTISTYMDDTSTYVGQETVAKAMGVSRRTVIRHVDYAKKHGWLHVEKIPVEGKTYRRNEYFATVPRWIELSDTDEELTDTLHAQEGDVGEEYDEPSNVTNGASNVTNHAEQCDKNADNDVTSYCHNNSSVISSYRTPPLEGATGAAPPSHWRHSEDHERPTDSGVPKAVGEVLQGSNGAAPTAITDSRRQRILELARQGYGMLAIAKMAGMAQPDVENIIREAVT